MTVCPYHVTYAFQSKSKLYCYLNIKEIFDQKRHDIWGLSNSNGTRTHNQLFRKRTLNHFAKLAKWLSCLLTTYLYGALDYVFLSCHERVSGWIYRYLNVKELLYWNKHNISSLTDSNCNGTQTHYHLIRKLTLIYLPRLAEWLTCAVSTYLYDAFDCVFLSCHIRISY